MTLETLIPNTPQEDLPLVDENKDYYAELVGPNQKFKTNQELAKSKVHADQTIDIYKRNMDQMRSDMDMLRKDNMTKAKLEELIDKLAVQPRSEHTPEAPETKPAQPDIESLVSSKIHEYELTKKQTENFNLVKTKLQEQYGNNYPTILKQQIDQLGLTDEDANALARKSPAAFFKTLGIDDKQQQNSMQSAPRSTQRNDNFAPRGEPKLTWSYFQNEIKKKPELKYDRKFNVLMTKAAVEGGEAFRDGDYYVKGLHDKN